MIKKYWKEIITLIIQLFMFYVSPLFAGPFSAMGMVFLIIATTLVLAILLGTFSKNKVKYLYPIVVAVAFLPSVFIYYNESALIHSLWYLIVSGVGMAIGAVVGKLINSR